MQYAMIVLCLLLAGPIDATPYRFEVVALEGQTIFDPNPLDDGDLGAITGLGRGPSINNNGRIALIAGSGSDVRLLLRSREDVFRNLRIPTFQVISNDVQVNDSDQISHRVETIDGALAGNTDARRLDSQAYPSSVIAAGPYFPSGTPFESVNHWTSLDNFGRVVASAVLKSNFRTALIADDDASGPGADSQSGSIGGSPDLFPRTSDDGKTIVRFGGSNTWPLLLLRRFEHVASVAVTTAAYLQSGDGETASRLATLANARRQNLTTLGLDCAQRELDLRDYLAQQSAQNGAPRANGADAEPQVADAEITSASGDGGANE